MIAECQHGAPWERACAACESERDADEPTSIGQLERGWHELASALERRGRADDLQRAALTRESAPAWATSRHYRQAAIWHDRHPTTDADLGGEG